MVSSSIYYAIGTWNGCINVLSLIFNGTAARILFTIDRSSRTPVSLTLLILCLNNVIQCIANQILVTPACFTKQWFWGDGSCTFYAFLTYWLALTSIYEMTLLSWQHHAMLTSKSVVSRRASNCSRLTPHVLCAALALFWCALPLVGWSSYGLEGVHVSCSLNWDVHDTSHVTYNVAATVMSFLFPIVTMSLLYIKLYLFIKRNSLKPDSASRSGTQRADLLLIRLGVIVTVTFFCIWAPYAVVCLITAVNPTGLSALTKTIPSLFAKGSTFALPIVFLFIHKDYKRRLMETFNLVARREVRSSTLQNMNKTDDETDLEKRLANGGQLLLSKDHC